MSPRLPQTKDSQMAVPLATPLAASTGEDDALRYLIDAGTALDAAVDHQMLLETLARLAVPRLADWCTVDLLDADAGLQRVAAVHPDAALRSLLRDIGYRAADRLDAPLGIGKVARTGERELIPDIDEATLAVLAQDPEQLALWRTLGLRSRLILPMRWGDRVLGTIFLALADSGRRFDERMVALAEELARRAAAWLAHASTNREVNDLRSALAETRRDLLAAGERVQATARELSEQLRLTAEARELADEANSAKGQFLARMSHELRTPLNAIGGYTQLLEMGVRGPITGEQREDLMRIQRSQRHLLSLVNDVLNFAKLQSGRVAYELAPVQPARLVDELAGLIEPQLQAKDHRLELAGMDGDAEVLADAEKMRQILLNLLSNATKFTSAGGRLRVFVESDAADVRIGVQDSGIGLPAEKLESIFEPFVQLSHPLAGVQQGTGLGLAISRDLARGMGGDLVAVSEPGAGSTFTLVLPRATEDGRRSASGAAPPDGGAPAPG